MNKNEDKNRKKFVLKSAIAVSAITAASAAIGYCLINTHHQKESIRVQGRVISDILDVLAENELIQFTPSTSEELSQES